MHLAKNIVANFAGRAWTIVLSIAFVPVYVRLLGIEAYGLIGFFTAMLSVCGLLDAGLSMALNRELARTRSGEDEKRSRNLLRTLETCYWPGSVLTGALVVVFAPWLATHWVNHSQISLDDVTAAIRAMGCVLALQIPMGLYQGGMYGLQRQVSANVLAAIAGTLRVAGGALIVWTLSVGVVGYFIWQIAISGVATLLFSRALWSALPRSAVRARFDGSLLTAIWPFAAAVAANAVIGILLTQLDKVVLTGMLTLEEFGYYTMAGVVSSALWAVILPINTALYPRFVQVVEQGSVMAIRSLYRRACGIVAAAVLPISALLIVYPREIIHLWTRSDVVAERTHLLVALLAMGTALNGMTSAAGYLQSAAGWPQLVLRTNAALAVVLVPALLIFVPRFGAVGAAWVWVAINCTYVLVTTPLMHRRILPHEYWRWLACDFLLPVALVALVGLGSTTIFPRHASLPVQVMALGAVWLAAAVVVVIVLPAVRHIAIEFIGRSVGRLMHDPARLS